MLRTNELSDRCILKLGILQGYKMMNLLASLSLVIGESCFHINFGHPNSLYLKKLETLII